MRRTNSKRGLKYWLLPVAIALGIAVVSIAANNAMATTGQCWTKGATHTFGQWWTGFGQRISDTTTFCQNTSGTKLVYRATHVSPGTVLCTVDSGGVSSYRTYGAADGTQNHVEWVDEVHFTCPEAIPGWYVHVDDKIELYATTGGAYKLFWSND